MKGIFHIIIFFLFQQTVCGQTDLPNSLWIDKPMVKADTVAIINSGCKKIEVYTYDAIDGPDGKPTYVIILVGTWAIKAVKNDMVCSWTGSYKLFSNWDHVTFQKTKAGKITQIIGQDNNKFELTHYLDKKGIVTHTTNKIMSKFETRYHFDKINYLYKDGLLVEASYLSSSYDPKTFPYTKYVFEYIK